MGISDNITTYSNLKKKLKLPGIYFVSNFKWLTWPKHFFKIHGKRFGYKKVFIITCILCLSVFLREVVVEKIGRLTLIEWRSCSLPVRFWNYGIVTSANSDASNRTYVRCYQLLPKNKYQNEQQRSSNGKEPW